MLNSTLISSMVCYILGILSRILMSSVVNHSCEPNVVFDLSSSDTSKWHVRALKPIEEGDKRKLVQDRPRYLVI